MLAFAPAQPKAVTSTAIIIDGKRIGRVDEHAEMEHGKYRFHACIEMREVGLSGHACGLAQGHGPSPEAAVAHAITSSITNARDYIAGLERLALAAGVAL